MIAKRFLRRELQKREPTRRGQRHRRRILMMRRDAHGSDRPPRDHALEGLSSRPCSSTRTGTISAPAILNASHAGRYPGCSTAIASPDESARAGKRERHLAPARDEDAALVGSQTARRGQHRGERFTEPQKTGWIT
jgi:hypothetical protein